MTDETTPDTATRYARFNLSERLGAEGEERDAIMAGKRDKLLNKDDRSAGTSFLDRRTEHNSHGGRWNEREAAFRTKVVRHG